MCGRFTLTQSKDELENRFGVKILYDYRPRYNAAPSQFFPVILNTDPDVAHMLRWGLMPPWAKKIRKDGLINVRAETLRGKPTFKADVEKRRCLVLADGFYEWKRTKTAKQPFRVVLKNDKSFAFAGIWEVDQVEGKDVPTFAIITTAPNDVLKPIHTRMPVVLEPGRERQWLKEPDLDLLRPFPSDGMRAYPVSPLVNKVTVENAALIEPFDAHGT